MKKILNLICHPSRWRVRGRTDAGMATAEYAVGTVAVISFGTLLYKIISDTAFRDLIWQVVMWIIKLIMGISD